MQAIGAAATATWSPSITWWPASATVGLLGREGTTLRKTVWPTLYYINHRPDALFAIHGLGIGDPLLARDPARTTPPSPDGAIVRDSTEAYR